MESPQLKGVTPFRQSPAQYHVIVAINGGTAPPLPKIPFHTVLLNWTVPPGLLADALVENLRTKIHQLVTTLRGENAP